MTTGMTCTLRVTAPDRETARVSVRRHQFVVGRPMELDDAAPRIAALEYALGALGGEVVNGLRVFASRRRLEIDHIEAVVTATLEHELAYLEVVGESGPPRIARLYLKIFVASPDASGIRQLWPDLLERLPLLDTLRLAVATDLDLILT
jgi:hypothetical protein